VRGEVRQATPVGARPTPRSISPQTRSRTTSSPAHGASPALPDRGPLGRQPSQVKVVNQGPSQLLLQHLGGSCTAVGRPHGVPAGLRPYPL
jgi:hypothetical protein